MFIVVNASEFWAISMMTIPCVLFSFSHFLKKKRKNNNKKTKATTTGKNNKKLFM